MNEPARHTLSVVIEEGGLDMKIICHESDNAYCRRACLKGCEEFCSDPDEHMGQIDHCLAVEWISQFTTEDHYYGEKRPIRDGMPIEVDWSGDNWVWSIPEPASAESSAVPA